MVRESGLALFICFKEKLKCFFLGRHDTIFSSFPFLNTLIQPHSYHSISVFSWPFLISLKWSLTFRCPHLTHCRLRHSGLGLHPAGTSQRVSWAVSRFDILTRWWRWERPGCFLTNDFRALFFSATLQQTWQRQERRFVLDTMEIFLGLNLRKLVSPTLWSGCFSYTVWMLRQWSWSLCTFQHFPLLLVRTEALY